MQYIENESGQGLVEYAFILSFVSVAAVMIMVVLGSTVTGLFNEVLTAFQRI